MEIVRERLREDILETAAFGELDVETGYGRTVLTGGEADRAAREYFVERLESAGLTVRIDPVGNIAGRWVPDGVDLDAAPVAMGSHLDSVPQGGIFDGPLGVYGALEAVRAIQAADISLERPLEVVSFTEEEGGRFGIGTLGSSVTTGGRSPEDTLELEDDEGWTLADRLSSIDFDGDETINPADWNAWLELHIEQGTRLESTGSDIGIVDSITGITNCAAEVRGEADHAGATPMDDRTDALVAAAEFVQAVEEIASDIATEHPAAVATVGQHAIEPNVRNIVPGRVDMQLDLRDVEHETIDTLVDRVRRRLERIAETRAVETTFERFRDDPPSHMSDQCIAAAVDAADSCTATAKQLHSAAMHDTANVSNVTDAGLLFAPSKDGVSHTPREWTDWDDCATATRILAETAARLATSSIE